MGYLESLQLFYTPNNELEKSIKIHQQGFDVTTTTTNYYYDAFGRRIGKSSSTQKSSKLNQRGQLVRFPSNLSSLNTTDRPQRKNTLMLWDGNRQIQEYTDEQIFTTVYEQGSFEPVARVVQLSEILEKQRIDNAVTHVWQYVPSGIITQDVLDNVEKAKQPLVKIYHYHNNHLGTPQELTNQDGDVIWLTYDRAWGGSFETIYKPQFIDNWAISESELQPIKFQGQCLDTETGLHYNRFRYYDSDVGMFISRDPIGLLGGNNVFQYAPNPIGWIDPWGLAKTTNLSALDKMSIEASQVLPERTRSAVTVAVGRGESGQLYVSTSEKTTRPAIRDWASDNNVINVNSRTPDMHAEESLRNFAPEKMSEIGSSKPICLDCETGMRKNDIDFNEENTSGKKSKTRKSNNRCGVW